MGYVDLWVTRVADKIVCTLKKIQSLILSVSPAPIHESNKVM